MPLNEQQRHELASMLDSHTFRKAQEETLKLADESVDDLPLDQAAIQMANEKGVRRAFKLLHQLSREPVELPPPSLVKPLSRTKHTRTNA